MSQIGLERNGTYINLFQARKDAIMATLSKMGQVKEQEEMLDKQILEKEYAMLDAQMEFHKALFVREKLDLDKETQKGDKKEKEVKAKA